MYFLNKLKNYIFTIIYKVIYWFKYLPGRLTYSQRKLPNFIIIGVPKSGSTFLFNTLNKHPQIKGSSLKEPQYFDAKFEKGERYYKGFFPYSSEEFITGEASVNYFYSSKAAKRIKKLLPKVKIILLLRNPVERAYSHFQMNAGALKHKDFNLIIDPKNVENKRFGFVEKGHYSKYLKTWLELFSRDQMMIIKSEELFGNSVSELQKVIRFLDLKPFQFKNLIPLNARTYNKIDSKLELELKAFYQKGNEELVQLIGEKFNWN